MTDQRGSSAPKRRFTLSGGRAVPKATEPPKERWVSRAAKAIGANLPTILTFSGVLVTGVVGYFGTVWQKGDPPDARIAMVVGRDRTVFSAKPTDGAVGVIPIRRAIVLSGASSSDPNDPVDRLTFRWTVKPLFARPDGKLTTPPDRGGARPPMVCLDRERGRAIRGQPRRHRRPEVQPPPAPHRGKRMSQVVHRRHPDPGKGADPPRGSRNRAAASGADALLGNVQTRVAGVRWGESPLPLVRRRRRRRGVGHGPVPRAAGRPRAPVLKTGHLRRRLHSGGQVGACGPQ